MPTQAEQQRHDGWIAPPTVAISIGMAKPCGWLAHHRLKNALRTGEAINAPD
jgi:hypothetical protein